MSAAPGGVALERLAGGATAAVTGLGAVTGAPCDPVPFLRNRKLRKFMGTQDDLAVVAIGRALEQACLAGRGLGPRAGLFLAVGVIPFERADIDVLLAASVAEGAFSMQRFSTDGFAATNPLLTFRCLSNMPAFHASLSFDVQGPYLVTYPGPGQLYLALEEALAALDDGRVDVALVAGVAHQRNELVAHHARRLGADPGALGDAAGCLVLERAEAAAARGARARARLVEASLGYRPFHPFEELPARDERFEGCAAPALELGPASLPVALAAAAAGTTASRVAHALASRDGLAGRSVWDVTP